MTRDEALDKIKKCLALAASPLPHEAAAAMRQAQKLMRLFNLTEVDVSLADVSEVRQRAQSVPLVQWEVALCEMVAAAFGCDYYTSQGLDLGLNKAMRVRRLRSYVFIGVGAAPEVAGYAFDVLSRQCARDRRRHVAAQPKVCKPKTKVARGDAYAQGWVVGVSAKLAPFAGSERDRALIEDYMARHHANMKSTSIQDRTKGKNVSHNDFHRGREAGRNAELNHGVGANTARPLLTE